MSNREAYTHFCYLWTVSCLYAELSLRLDDVFLNLSFGSVYEIGNNIFIKPLTAVI